MSKKKRPEPVSLGWARASVVRGPRADGRWYWRIRAKGSRQTVWTGWATTEEATVEVGRELASGPAPRPSEPEVGRPETLDDLLCDWLAHQERKRDAGTIAPLTYSSYKTIVQHWRAEAAASVLLNALSLPDLEETALIWKASGLAPRTINGYIEAVGYALNWGAQRGYCRKLRTREARLKVDGYVNNSRTPTPAEVGRIAAQMHEPYKSLLLIEAWTGARVSEVAALTPDSYLDAETSLVLSGRDSERERRGKTGTRVVPLPPEAVPVLRALQASALEADAPYLVPLPKYVTGAMNQALRRACKAAKVERFTNHGLRRMVVMRLLDGGVDLKTISTITGHSIQTLLKDYVRPDEDRRRAAVVQSGLGTFDKEGTVVQFRPKRAQNRGTTNEE